MPDAASVKTTCPYCGVGCGVLAKLAADGSATVRGDPDHPANFGRLCSKGAALGETIGARRPAAASRNRRPRGVAGTRRSISSPRGSPRPSPSMAPTRSPSMSRASLLTEDYYVANKLMKGFIGSANIDTNSRLCMASSVAGHRRAFGADMVPGTYRRSRTCRSRRAGRLQPRLVPSGALPAHRRGQGSAARDARRADRSAPHHDRRDRRPASADQRRRRRGAVHRPARLSRRARRASTGPMSQAHTTGFEEALQLRRRSSTLAQIAAAHRARPSRSCYGVLPPVRRHREGRSPSTARASTSPSRGTDKVNAIINCHLATGRIGRPGMGPFSVTGQPNAMGGREVGGLANMLAAHMEIENADRSRPRAALLAVARPSPTRPGLKAVDMFRAVGDGRIKALWIMATNPVDSMPDADRGRAGASRPAPSSSCPTWSRDTDTIRHAHVKLPAAAWGEKDGTVTNSERRISRQRAFPHSSRRGAARLVDHLRSGASAWASPQPLPIARRRRSSPSTPRCRPSRMTAPAPSTSARWPASAARISTGWRRSNGRSPRPGRRGETSFFGDGGFLHRGRQGPLRAGPPAADRAAPTPPSRSSSIPAACATIGTP